MPDHLVGEYSLARVAGHVEPVSEWQDAEGWPLRADSSRFPNVYNGWVSTHLPLLRPYDRLIKIQVVGREFEVPEKNIMLRVFQYLSPEEVSMGRFCWNEDCQYCRVTYDTGEGTQIRKALSCKLVVEEGMRVVDATSEIKYGLRKVLK